MIAWLFSSCTFGDSEYPEASEKNSSEMTGQFASENVPTTLETVKNWPVDLVEKKPRTSLGPIEAADECALKETKQASLVFQGDGLYNPATFVERTRAITVAAFEIQKPQWKYRAAEVFVIICLGILIYFQNSWLSSVIESFRDTARDIDIYLIIFAFILLSMLRAAFPPWYFCFPLDATTQIILGDHYSSIYVAAIVWQLVGIVLYTMQFIMLQWGYTDFMKTLVEDQHNNNKGCYRFFYDVRQGIRLFDDHYRDLFYMIWGVDQNPPVWQEWGWNGTMVVLFFNCEYWSNYFCIIWLATRANEMLQFWQFFLFLVISLILEYPKAVIWIRIYIGVVESIRLNNFTEIFSEINIYEAIGYIIIAGIATIYIHGHHIYMMYAFLRDTFTNSSSTQRLSTQQTTIVVPEVTQTDIQEHTTLSVPENAVELPPVSEEVKRSVSFGVVQCTKSAKEAGNPIHPRTIK